MIVRNPTPGTIIYDFAGLTLSPGQSAEIDNSFVENVEFQIAQSNGTISVIKYDKDYVTTEFKAYVAAPLNNPSNEQKGAMVLSNVPSVDNPFATMEEIEINDIILRRYNDHVAEIYGVDSRYVCVANKKHQISSPAQFDLDVQFTIDSSGNLTGTKVPASSAIYFYLSGNGASLGEKLLKASIVSPSFFVDGFYLNTDRKWKFVGWGYTDENSKLKDRTGICSLFNEKTSGIELPHLVGIHVPLTSGIETIQSWSILLPPRYCFFASFEMAVESSELDDRVVMYSSGRIFDIKNISVINEANYVSSWEYVENDTDDVYIATFSLGYSGKHTSHSCDKSTIKCRIDRSRMR